MLRTTTVLNRFLVRPSRLLLLLFVALSVSGLLVLPRTSSAARYAQELEKLNRLVQTSGGSDAEIRIFRQGRDLIGDEAWDQPAKQFPE